MMDAIDKWQATAIVLAAIAALVIVALVRDDVSGELIVGAIGGIPSLVLGAGAVAHGVRQGSKASTDPPAGG